MLKLATIFILFFCKVSFAQHKFSNCSAAFLNGKMVVAHYDTVSKAELAIESKGELTVCTAELGENYAKAKDKLYFGIGIKDKNTGTIMLFSVKTFQKIKVEEVLQKCKKGDAIVLLTTNDAFALPHNEILIK